MLKKIFLKIINAISVLVILCAVAILLNVLLTSSGQAPSILGYSVFRVMTGSMEPAIPSGSLIIVQQTDPSELEEGDIISFYSRDPSLDGSVNTHRIVSIEQDEDQYYFTTRGDANNVDDRYTTLEGDIVGKVVIVSYHLGVLVRLISNPLIFIPLVLIPLAVILIMNLYQTISLAKKIAREEEEAAVREAVEEIRRKRQEENRGFDDCPAGDTKAKSGETQGSIQ